MSVDQEALAERFESWIGKPPSLVCRAPGRVNLIGEHIDYNGGLVLPAAIDRDVAMAARVAKDRSFRLRSTNYEEDSCWDAGDTPPPGEKTVPRWATYFLAVLERFADSGRDIPALEIQISGDVPTGSGLSSSAAFEVCAATLLSEVSGCATTGTEIARLAQAAEHGPYVGVQCGIMDQFASANGVEGHALKLDCESLEFETVRLDPSQAAILILHSTVERGLVDSAYNERRNQCAQALKSLNDLAGTNRTHLVDFGPEEFGDLEETLEDPYRKRARHVVTEQRRVVECVASLEQGDLVRAGALFNASHASLRDDYEVSCPELDFIHERAKSIEGVYGCRMTGAGFGGCAVALVDPKFGKTAAKSLSEAVEKETGKKSWVIETKACAGAVCKGLS